MADETENAVEVAPARTGRNRTLSVQLNRGYFPKDGGSKIERGSIVELPLDEAKAVISKGLATRADPLPE